MVKVNSREESATDTLEIPSPTVTQGVKHTALSSEMDPKRAAAILDRRRVSASINEIRDLYSALQELVPGNTPSSPQHRAISTEINFTSVSSNPTSPSLKRRNAENGAKDTPRSPTSEDESIRVRRLLPVTPDSPSNLRKFKPKVIQTLDVNANHGLTKGKRPPNMGRRGSSGEVLLSMKTSKAGNPSPNMGRRGSSGEVLLGVRANQLKAPKSPLAMTRWSSHLDIATACETSSTVLDQPVELDRLVSPERLDRRGSEGGILTPNMNKSHKKLSPLVVKRRGSSGDILSTENFEITSNNLTSSTVTSPRNGAALYTDSYPRRGSLMSALTKFSHSFKRKTPPASPQRKEAADAANQTVVDGPVPTKQLPRLESQMDMLLNSLQDLQGAEVVHANAIDTETPRKRDQRRGSLGSEMQELLGALHELSNMATSSDSDSIGENESRSRRGSELQDRVPVQRESLDQLEAYFTEKLRDATRANASKSPSERSSESEALHSDREDAELSQVSSEMSSKKISLEIGMADEGVDIVDGPLEVLPTESEVKRNPLMEDREEFASQVNKKLQDWLAKATALSEREKTEPSENFMTYDSEGAKYDSPDSDESDYNKDKEPKRMRRNLFSKLSLLRRGDKAKYKHRRTKSMHDVTFLGENDHPLQDIAAGNSQTVTTQIAGKSRRPSVTRSRSMYNFTLPRSNNSKTRQVKEAEDLLKATLNTETPLKPQSIHVAETHTPVILPNKRGIVTSQMTSTCSKDYCSALDAKNLSVALAKRELNKTRQKVEDNNVRLSAPKKRSRRLPTDLPFFYTPETADPRSCNTATRRPPKKTDTHIKIKLLPSNPPKEEIFYNEKKSDSRKLKKACSNTLTCPHILVNQSTHYFFGTTQENGKGGNDEGTLFYQGSSQSPLRRFASVDSFLNYTKDLQGCEEPRANGSCSYGHELRADDATKGTNVRGQSPCPSPPSQVWGIEFTI